MEWKNILTDTWNKNVGKMERKIGNPGQHIKFWKIWKNATKTPI